LALVPCQSRRLAKPPGFAFRRAVSRVKGTTGTQLYRPKRCMSKGLLQLPTIIRAQGQRS
jgi:hypothetical protein